MSDHTPMKDPVAEAVAEGDIDRVVLVIGQTGNGKSTVCNILYDGDSLCSDFFQEGDTARGMTTRHKVGKVRIGRMNLTIIDTLGISDPELSHEQVCIELAQAINSCKGGIHQVLFVMPGRLSKSEQETFSLMTTVLMNADVVKYTTIVRSKYPAFRVDSEVYRDLESMKTIKGGELVRAVAKVIHVDNPNQHSGSDWKERRRVSRERLLTRIAACSELYLPPELQVISARIAEVKRKETEVQEALVNNRKLVAELEEAKAQGNMTKELMEQLRQANSRTDALMVEMREESRRSAERMAEIIANMPSGGGGWCSIV